MFATLVRPGVASVLGGRGRATAPCRRAHHAHLLILPGHPTDGSSPEAENAARRIMRKAFPDGNDGSKSLGGLTARHALSPNVSKLEFKAAAIAGLPIMKCPGRVLVVWERQAS